MCLGGGGAPQVQTTEDQKVQEQNNAKLWNYYVTSYKPMLSKYVSMTQDPTRKTAQEKQVAGQINAEIMKEVDPSKVSSNPVADAARLAKLASGGTAAQVQGQGGVRSRQIGETENVIDIGRGQETTAQAGLSDIAGQSVRAAILSKEIEQQEQAGIEEAFGSVAGATAAGLMRPKTPNIPTTLSFPYGGDNKYGARLTAP